MLSCRREIAGFAFLNCCGVRWEILGMQEVAHQIARVKDVFQQQRNNKVSLSLISGSRCTNNVYICEGVLEQPGIYKQLHAFT